MTTLPQRGHRRRTCTNCYLRRRGRGWVLIDAGREERLPALIAALGPVGCDPDDVSCLVLTHGHSDHYGGAEGLPRALRSVHEAAGRLLPAKLRRGPYRELTGERCEIGTGDYAGGLVARDALVYHTIRIKLGGGAEVAVV